MEELLIEEKAKGYDDALERAKSAIKECGNNVGRIKMIESIFPELKESEDEKAIRDIKVVLESSATKFFKEEGKMPVWYDRAIAWLEKQGKPEDMGEVSDGYHTFNELYYYRMLYNAAFFNRLPKDWVHKSKRHHDGEECFGGGWFIVMANLPTGQISNHYELKDWDLFQIPEKDIADEWDGHTPQEAAERLHKFLLEKQGEHANFQNKIQIGDKVTRNEDGLLVNLSQLNRVAKKDEKQGAIKDGNSVDPNAKPITTTETKYLKFKVGDWVTDGDRNLFQITKIDNEWYYTDDSDRVCFDIVHDYYHLWTINDAKEGDVLVSSSNQPFLYNGFCNPDNVGAYCGIEALGEYLLFANETCKWTKLKNVHPATKEQCDRLFKKMAENGYAWDAEKKELKKLKMQDLVTSETNVTKISDQDSKWSEDDSWMFNVCCNAIDSYKEPVDKTMVKNWLNYIKTEFTHLQVGKKSDQDKWNNEDIRMLNTVINIFEKVYPSNYFTTFTTGSENPMLINSPEIVKWLKGIKQKALGKLKLTKEDLEALRIAIINLGDMAEVDAINNFNMTFGEAKEKLIEIKERYAE